MLATSSGTEMNPVLVDLIFKLGEAFMQRDFNHAELQREGIHPLAPWSFLALCKCSQSLSTSSFTQSDKLGGKT